MEFNQALQHVLKWEGGATITDDPDDPGGLTKYGISQAAYPNLDIENLTAEWAAQIYRSDYWEACRCDKLPAHLRLLVFDTAVNMGTHRAGVLLQTATNKVAGYGMEHGNRLELDGIIGPITLSVVALNAGGYNIIDEYCMLRTAHYRNLRTFAKYGNGWLNRVNDVHAQCRNCWLEDNRDGVS